MYGLCCTTTLVGFFPLSVKIRFLHVVKYHFNNVETDVSCQFLNPKKATLQGTKSRVCEILRTNVCDFRQNLQYYINIQEK